MSTQALTRWKASGYLAGLSAGKLITGFWSNLIAIFTFFLYSKIHRFPMTRLRIFSLIFLIFSLSTPAPPALAAKSQGAYTGDVASYNIQVSLDTAAKTITGHETITYLNTSRDPIPNLVFHLYLNAFKSADTIFMTESGTHHRFSTWDPEHPGWIEVTALHLANGTALTLEPLYDGTLARATLPLPVKPGQSVQVEVDFKALLPHVFARTGFAGGPAEDYYMVGQWFPKLGVWQNGGWNAYPYHANSEYYADYGSYDVAITLPTGYITGGGGLPASTVDNGNGTQTVTYQSGRVIDFSWTASPHFKTASRIMEGVEILYLVLPEHSWSVKRVLDAAQAALENFGAWYGPYPYPRLTLVDVPDDGPDAGGMEYPTLVTVGMESLLGMSSLLPRVGIDHSLEAATIHEIGHQWWYAMVGFNEAEEPWLDEGFTDYSAARLLDRLYPEAPYLLNLGNYKLSYFDERRSEYLGKPDLSMYGKAWDFSEIDYGIAVYRKPVVSLTTLENVLGTPTMLELMSTFFQRFQFKHPNTQDFRDTVTEVAGSDQAWFFDGLVYGKGTLDYQITAIDGKAFTVERVSGLSELVIPTEILVTFQDGSSLLQPWDGSSDQPTTDRTGATRTFSYTGRPAIQSAVIDPERKLLVDLQWSNNGKSARADLWSWAAVVTRFLYYTQNALLTAGGW
jgi:hypothetical protein